MKLKFYIRPFAFPYYNSYDRYPWITIDPKNIAYGSLIFQPENDYMFLKWKLYTLKKL